MVERIEYEDCYVIRREVAKYAPEKKMWEVEIDEGITATFIDTKRYGGPIKLGELIFDKNRYSFEDACDYWTDMDIQCYEKKKVMNRMFRPLEFAMDVGELVVVGCYRNANELGPKQTLRAQLKEMEKE